MYNTSEIKNLINDALKLYITPKTLFSNKDIFSMAEYSLLSGGKRLRGILLIEWYLALGGTDIKKVMPFACSLEMIHAYSLIHDDLPCMDDDDMRRGKLALHKVHGEDMAILAGDLLLNLAFETMLSATHFNSDIILAVSKEIAGASGGLGMIAGQVMDIYFENEDIDIENLEKLQLLKTGELIRVSCKAGAMLATENIDYIGKSEQYGINLGRAFQICDDILDIEGSAQDLGKPIGSDAILGKATYPSLLGLEKSKELAREYTDNAIDILKSIDNNRQLLEITQLLLKRRM